MKFFILLITVLAITCAQIKAEYVKTDSIDLGEDRSSHNYQEFGATIKIGTYSCDGDLSISIGANDQFDAIVFYMKVIPNTDRIMVQWNYSWFNAGSNKDLFTKIKIENEFEESLYSPGQNAVGGDPISCSLDSHKLEFSGLSEYTADSLIRVKIFDPYPSFSGNSSICKFIVYSDPDVTSSTETEYLTDDIRVFPNPSKDYINIKSGNRIQSNFYLLDMFGVQVLSGKIGNNEKRIDISELPVGIYILRIEDKSFKIIKI